MSKLVLIHSGHNSTVIFYENVGKKKILKSVRFQLAVFYMFHHNLYMFYIDWKKKPRKRGKFWSNILVRGKKPIPNW